jgi:lipoprotein-releasing system ATP-binding protein
MTELLRARALTKTYWLGDAEIPVLRGVDLSVEAGEMVALLGASGAGKSTLLHVLGLLDVPTSGEVLFDGRPVHDLSARAKAKLRHQAIGFVFQFYHLIPELTALENVLLGEMMFRGPLRYWSERTGIRARAMALLTEVGLGQRLQHRPNELSGGEKQRVAIARALIATPRVILADEPTGNLDSATADGVLQLLFRINRERRIAFVLVTHNEELAARCDRIVRLRDGKVLAGVGVG